ncbi:hypothetical protein MVES1_001491 [Malassezia vespertilionis]|uniref:Uncharacterized protein n=1 Tax=Malassezia vespertilionis TaxID=2020962 RepID=A0A2N1JCF1_9BASI|nr:uncharacterized protein MVES1_001491 [Malassezia vespertilionis]PKI84217.1 hypothetical protein MVES_001404 [Malassezia vespertilionis]WFD06149.1 hypothetical protein MVES1_001491 [Malassezia vespertilionis]
MAEERGASPERWTSRPLSGEVSALGASHTRARPPHGVLRATAPPGNNNALWRGKELVYGLNSKLSLQNLPNIPLKLGARNASNPVSGFVHGMLRRLNGSEYESLDKVRERHRRVHFRVEDMVHTYAIAHTEAPSAEGATRRRLEQEYTKRAMRLRSRAWLPQELQGLYRMCCRAREEQPLVSVLAVFEQAASWTHTERALDFTAVHLRHGSIALADALGAPMGLTAVVLEACALADSDACALVHALALQGSVRKLSLAGNPAVRLDAWQAVGALLSCTLTHLDVSENVLSQSDVCALLASMLGPIPSSEGHGARNAVLTRLQMEQCQLKTGALETIAHAVRASALRHLSLRRNRLGPACAEALALSLVDYPGAWEEHARKMQDSYGQRIARVQDLYGTEAPGSVSKALLHGTPVEHVAEREAQRAQLQSHVATLHNTLAHVPRIGELRILDLKSNHLGASVAWLGHALKANRTLRVLSVNENQVPPEGLAELASALWYNRTLETLDLGRNPCCGPDLAGVLALRVLLAVHPGLRRVFLPETQLTSGAFVALAECLPDAHTLHHLDLSRNSLSLVGIMALELAMRENITMRCLDLTIDPSDEETVPIARKIYQVCVANTEAAQARAANDAHARQIGAPLAASALGAALRAASAAPTLAEALVVARRVLEDADGGKTLFALAKAQSTLLHVLQQTTDAEEGLFDEALRVNEALLCAIDAYKSGGDTETRATRPPARPTLDTDLVQQLESPRSPNVQRANGLLTEESEVFRMTKNLEAEHDGPAHVSPDHESNPARHMLAEQFYDEDKTGAELRHEILEATHHDVA